MGLNLKAAGDVLNKGLVSIAHLKWVLFGVLIVAVLISVVVILSKAKKKKLQWTHTFRVRRADKFGHMLPGESIHLARRTRNKDGVDIFELDKPILGNLVIPQPGEYSGPNEFSIIIDANNRIWNNQGEFFNKDKQSINVSAVHSGIDISMQELNQEWKMMHPTPKKISAMEIIKVGMIALGIIALMVLGIVAIQNHAKNVSAQSQAQIANAQANQKIAEVIPILQKIVNTQQLQITPALQAMYPGQSISSVINKYRVNSTNSTN